jgi:hypothetical protein
MTPKYKSKMRQKKRERARANRAESKESNKRHATLESINLAQFMAWYGPAKRSNDEDGDGDTGAANEVPGHEYRRREVCKIIRYRNYDIGDVNNYKREMVTLHVPIRNEHVEIIDCNRFLKTYEAHEHVRNSKPISI